MAIDKDMFIRDAAVYTQPNISPKTQRCLVLYGKAVLLGSLGGTDYTSAMHSTLVNAALTAFGSPTQNQIVAGNIRSYLAGAAVDVGILLGPMQRTMKLELMADWEIDLAEAYLECAIQAAAGYSP